MRGAREGFREEGFGRGTATGGRVPERETWEAFWEGGPRNREGGGSRRCLGLDLGDC
jgi:hypothetical protein